MSLVVLFSTFLVSTTFSQLDNGGVFYLTPCGRYSEYQKYTLKSTPNNTIQLHLSSYNSSCVDCSGCSAGTTPWLWECYNPGDFYYPNQIYSLDTSDLGNTMIKSVGYSNVSSCISFPYNVAFQKGVMSNCDGSDITNGQNFTYDSSTGYLQSYYNNSLCVTAYYFTPPSCNDSPYNTFAYCNETLPAIIRAQDLVSRMNFVEKISILENGNNGVLQFGFPRIGYNEALHGVLIGCGAKTYNNPDGGGCATSFPHATLLGASFNRTLWRDIGNSISDEARAFNNQGWVGLTFWAPNINLCRDPRWGRCQEVPGEDPYLTSQYVMEYSHHMQYGIDKKYLKVVSTAKHYADYDQEGNWGTSRFDFNAIVTDSDQVEYYWPHFRAAVQTARIQSSMCSYNGVNGVPSCGNDYFMNQVMREEWGFEGFFVSDCGAITDGFFTDYVNANFNGNNEQRIQFAISSGCDAECGGSYNQYGPDAYVNGILLEDTLNRAATRILAKSFELGVLDSNVYYTSYGPDYIDNNKHRSLALDAAQQGIVLLKNDNNILPLKSDYSQNIAMIGPHFNATQNMLSNYHGGNYLVNSHSPYQAIVNLIGSSKVTYAEGCDINCASSNSFPDAVNVAKTADIAIVFLGLVPYGGCAACEAEGYDRNTLEFPGMQLQLLQNVSSVNPNTILVLINGGTIDISWPKSSNNVPGIIESFYPGEFGGDALINILYGKVSPAGKLPLTIYPQSMADARTIMDMNLKDNGGITYRYYQGTPVYGFGYGLSYTTFTYTYYNSNETVYFNTKKLADYYRNKQYYYREAISYKIGVTNTGSMNSDCVVLGFVYSNNTDSPQKKLFDFERVYVPMGATVNVTLSASAESISLTNKYGNERIVPGLYKITIGDLSNYIIAYLELFGEEESIFDLYNLKKNKK